MTAAGMMQNLRQTARATAAPEPPDPGDSDEGGTPQPDEQPPEIIEPIEPGDQRPIVEPGKQPPMRR